ncbi:hypothetical protein BSV1_R11 (plasmid) [Borreliella finlandensis]|uniref:Uncharacterized protein n=1 Tax=Borreliella finlandensis TaxID=498741 RepID=A0A806C7X7_9SPIR|nr:hypothetical protein BSV1_R11 [Borreliella finlandensis]
MGSELNTKALLDATYPAFFSLISIFLGFLPFAVLEKINVAKFVLLPLLARYQ